MTALPLLSFFLFPYPPPLPSPPRKVRRRGPAPTLRIHLLRLVLCTLYDPPHLRELFPLLRLLRRGPLCQSNDVSPEDTRETGYQALRDIFHIWHSGRQETVRAPRSRYQVLKTCCPNVGQSAGHDEVEPFQRFWGYVHSEAVGGDTVSEVDTD